jgi:hypothetical protein
MRAAIATLAVAGALVAPATAGAADFSSGLGCSVKCIRSALATPTTDAARIDVRTDTPAKIVVYVRKRVTGELLATRTSNGQFKQDFTTFVLGLEGDTLYEIAVHATDAQGRRYWTSGTFRTLKPQTVGVDQPGGGLTSEAGCGAQCVRSAEVVPGVNAAKLKVVTNVPAKLEITADRKAPVQTQLGPFFAGQPEVRYTTSDMLTEWNGSLRKLRSNRRYHVIIRATDANGNVSARTGVFETGERNVRITFEKVHVSFDGDDGANRGELGFVAGVNGGWQLRRGEDKVKSNSTVKFNKREVNLADVPQILDLKVQGVERDLGGRCLNEFGEGPFEPELSGRLGKKCAVTWNTAVGQLDLDSTWAKEQTLPPGFGGAGTYNMRIKAERGGVRFEADVRIDVWTG